MRKHLALAGALLLLLGGLAHARDDGRYAQSPHKQWFDSLKNKLGASCCADNDGIRLEDPEWQCASATQCKVRLGGVWYDVPEYAILETTNRVGYPIVWRTPNPIGHVTIICFLRGTEI